jgi:L-histidine Nalpha-methyltransferase
VTAQTRIGVEIGASPELAQFAADVRYYLVQDPRQLPSRYLYDALGSALFDAICHLPWYGITRAESRLLNAHAAEIMRLAAPSAIVELGPGSGEKLRMLLDGAGRTRPALDVHLVDVSPRALRASAETHGALDGVRVTEHACSYEAGLADAARHTRTGSRTLVLFLGSNIGNFDPPGAAALLRNIRAALSAGDALVLGADLVKPEPVLLLAYDDPLGVTAAFNRNLLVRVNRELHANFALEEFAHQAVWNAGASRVEMHLVARRAQHVEIPGAGIEIAFGAGERIWTESSYKYRSDEIVAMLEGAGLRVTQQWIEPQERFALTLAEAAG